MNDPWTFNSSSTAKAPTLKELVDLARRFAARPPEPIIAIQTTLAELRRALAGASVKSGVPGLHVPSPLDGLDVVEEDGWVYAGTTRQLAEARRLFGSLALARKAGDILAKLKEAPR